MTSVIVNSNGNVPTESNSVLYRWTKHRKDLYYFSLRADFIILQDSKNIKNEPANLSVVPEESKRAAHSIERVDNVHPEVLDKKEEVESTKPLLFCHEKQGKLYIN